MNGIASLPQGSNMPQGAPPQGMPQQAPGQAVPGQMPGIPMPQAQGTPMGIASDNVKQLTQLNDQMLMNLFGMSLSGQIKSPQPISILAAISQKNKEAAAAEAVKRQMSQMQNAQNQQAGTVADQEFAAIQNRAQQPVMARHGGVMHSYRQGGIVGYQSGGATSYPVTDPEDETTLPLNERIRRTLARLRMGAQGADERSVNERLREALPDVSMPSLRRQPEEGPRQWQQATQGEEPDLMGETLIPFNEPDIGQAPNVAMLGKTGYPDVDIGPAQPRVAPPPAAPSVTPQAAPQTRPQAVPQAAAPSDYERRIQELQGAIGAQKNLPPELLKSQQGLGALVEQQIADRERRANELQERVRKEYQAAQEQQKFGPMDWFALAGGISTEKGQLMGSLGRATAGVMGAKKAELKEAQKAYNAALDADRRERDAIGQMRILEGQRQLALEQREYDKANQLEIEIKKLSVEAAKYGAERQDKQEQLAATRMQAEAAKTQAGKESETDRKIRLAKEDPALFSQMYGPKDKDLAFPALKAQADLIAERLKDPLLDANQKTALTAEYNKIMGALSRLSGVGGMSSQPLYAVNPKTKERIVSIDGGATWNPAK